MTKSHIPYFIVFFVAFLFATSKPVLAFSTNLDDMYREMLKDNNKGNLPTYVVNREPPPPPPAPKVEKKKKKKKKVTSGKKTSIGEVINFSRPKETRSWQDVVIAVQKGEATPFDVAKIKDMAAENDHDALEMLAWMYANGIAMKQDLHKAWALYSKAARIGIPGAIKNANAVYKAMSDYQRTTLPPY